MVAHHPVLQLVYHPGMEMVVCNSNSTALANLQALVMLLITQVVPETVKILSYQRVFYLLQDPVLTDVVVVN
jgi:hypothetical protein